MFVAALLMLENEHIAQMDSGQNVDATSHKSSSGGAAHYSRGAAAAVPRLS
jgi:hypothetical protein